MKLISELLVEQMTDEEKERAGKVESVLPALREHAAEVDLKCEFYRSHVQTLSNAGFWV